MSNQHALPQPLTASVQISRPLRDGSVVTATMTGPGATARDREELIHAAIDTVLSTSIRVGRTMAPFQTPTPMVPASNPAEFACQNLDGERIA